MTSRMSETDLLNTVIDLCKVLKLKVAHFRPAKTKNGWVTPVQGDGAGFPDLVIVGHFGVLFRELKSTAGKLSSQQQWWISDLDIAGCDSGTWRPENLKNGDIMRELHNIKNSPEYYRERHTI